jgi:tetratricopeptide (TPR) repeat protein
MSETVSNAVDRDLRLTQVLDAYLAGLPKGATPNPDELLARHPDLADDLKECLDCLAFIRQAARPADAAAARGDAASQESAPRELGDFRIVREVSKGGMGVVYEAEQLSLGRRVALKVLPFAATLDPRQLQRFKNEAQAAAGLHHTNIVPVHFVGCERGVHFYAMQYIDGQSLAAVIAELRRLAGPGEGGSEASPVLSAAAEALVRGQTMPELYPANGQAPTISSPLPCRTDGQSVLPGPAAAETAVQAPTSLGRSLRSRAYFEAVARLGVQAAEALEHAHALGVIHRDVKPGNLLLDGRGNLWVTDFGLAHCQSQAGLTMTGDLVGTLRYMSPEQALAKRVVVDHRTDVYSLGATLYELLTLEPAFAGSDREELLRQIAFEEPRSPRRHNKAIPADLETVVLKALAKNPAERYATTQEVADDLRRFLKHKPIWAQRPTLAQRARKWARRHRTAVWSAAVVLLVAMLLGAGEWLRRAQQQAGAEQEVAVALREAARLQEEGKWPEALAAARRAEAVLAGGAVGADLEEEVWERRADLEMVATLEDIRLQKAAVHDDHFASAAAGPAYAKAFREYGIDVTALDPVQAGQRLRQKSIRVQLAAALDDWAFLPSEKKDKPSRRELLVIAGAADPDLLRNEVRSALHRGDAQALKQLAASDRLTYLPPSTLVLVAKTLRRISATKQRTKAGESSAKEAVSVLQKAQQLYPGDFWINEELGEQLEDYTKPPDLEGAIRFHTAAVALRPRSPGAYVNLGFALNKKGFVDDAIAAYKKAISLKPDLGIAHTNLGVVLNKKGLVDGAIAAHKKALRLNPDMAGANYNLGLALQRKGMVDKAIAAFKKALRFNPDMAVAHYDLGIAFRAKGLVDEAIVASRKAIRLKPEYAKAHISLGMALCTKKSFDEAIDAFEKAIRLNPDDAVAHTNMGIALHGKGLVDEAIAAFKKAISLKPDFSDAHNNLGVALAAKGLVDEAIAAFEKAISLKPDNPEAHNNLVLALQSKGMVDEAIAASKKAISLKPDYAKAYFNLGCTLKDKGLVNKAIVAWKNAISLKPDYAEAHYNLGMALITKGLVDEAIAAYKEAIHFKPDYAEAHNNLGVALDNKGLVEEAIAAFQEAIRLKPDLAEPYFGLGGRLQKKGAFSESLAAYRRGHELGSKRQGWPYPSGQLVRQAEELLRADKRLSAVLNGTAQPVDAGECLDFARLCHEYRRRYAAAARFYKEAFATNPKLADMLAGGHRYNAACVAALAGCGHGKDTGGLDEKERARLRQQALHWLRADLAAWGRQLEKGAAKTHPVVAAQMRHWQVDPDFARMRGKEALAKLPEPERAAWRQLWADVEKMLDKTRGKPPTEAKTPEKP